MNDYAQPEFYRFNEDSIKLLRWISEEVKTLTSILDLGAGCGILGYELARVFKARTLHLVELQNDFIPYLKTNSVFAPEATVTIECTSYGNFCSKLKYDLVVANPPYYLPESGKLPEDQRRAKARSFLVDSWHDLLNAMSESLSSRGYGFLVIKNDPTILKVCLKAIGQSHLAFIQQKKDDLVLIKLWIE